MSASPLPRLGPVGAGQHARPARPARSRVAPPRPRLGGRKRLAPRRACPRFCWFALTRSCSLQAEPAAERASLTFEWLVLLAHVTLDTQAGAESGGAGGSGGGSCGGGGGKRSKKQKRAAGLSLLGRASFARVEEELLAEGAEAVSLVRGGLPGGGQLLLMLLRPEALAAAVPAMRAVMCD